MSIKPHVQALVDRELTSPGPRHHVGDQAALIASTTLAGVAISAALPQIPLTATLFGTVTSLIAGEADQPKARVLPPDLQEAINVSVWRRSPIAAFHAPAQDIISWNAWVASVWEGLVAGGKIKVPESLAHPRVVGFEHTCLASSVGQQEDWVLPLPDGSRLHAHEYDHGAIVLHRDAVDPGRGVFTAIYHWGTETREGAMTATIIGIASMLIWLGKTKDDPEVVLR